MEWVHLYLFEMVSSDRIQVTDYSTDIRPTYTSNCFLKKSAYQVNVTDLYTDKYPVDDSTSTYTHSYTYIEITSDNLWKFYDCHTEIHSFYGIHSGYLPLHHSASKYTTSSNALVNEIIGLIKLHNDIDRYPTKYNITDSQFIVETRNKKKGELFSLSLNEGKSSE